MGFIFCDLHVSLKQPFVGGHKFVEFVLFHISNIGTKNKLTKQTVKILSSGFTMFANVCPNLHDVRIYPTLP